MMKFRCCNCGFVSQKSEITRDQPRCPKCGSSAVERLSPLSGAQSEGREGVGGLLLEVPMGRDNLME
jgi:ssDNA-binding Zn-finger/Zn-ribbon topoisomerase 1